MHSVFATVVDVDCLLLAGWRPTPDTVLRFDVTAQEAQDLYGVPNTTAREVIHAMGGLVPVVYAPVDAVPAGNQTYGGMEWELSMLSQGWWYEDPSTLLAGPGPQYGQEMTAPDVPLTLFLASLGDEWWWV